MAADFFDGPPLTYGRGPYRPSDPNLPLTTTRGASKTAPGGASGPGTGIPSVTVPGGDPSTLEIPSIYRSELGVGPLRGPGPGGVGNIDPRFINAVIATESGGRNVIGSDKKSMGVMQITADTARRMGYAPADMMDPQKNVQAGTQLLQHLLTKYKGDMFQTLAAYNAGEGAVDSGRIPASTRQYVQKVMANLKAGAGDSLQNTLAQSQQPAVKSGQVLEIPQQGQKGPAQGQPWSQAAVDPAAVPQDPFKALLPPGYANRMEGGLRSAQPSIDPFREMRAQYSPTFGGPGPMSVPRTVRNLSNYPAQAIVQAYTPRLIQAFGPERGRQAAQLLAMAAPLVIGTALGAPEAGGETQALGSAPTEPLPPGEAQAQLPPPSGPPGRVTTPIRGLMQQGEGVTQPLPGTTQPLPAVGSPTEPLPKMLRNRPGGIPSGKLQPGTQVDIYPGTSYGTQGTVVEPGTPAAGRPAYPDEQLTPPSPQHVAVREKDTNFWRWRHYNELGTLEPYAQTGELQYHGGVGKRPTKPLEELAAQPPRYHGTPVAIGEMLNPDEVPGGGQGLLQGQGFYSTDDLYDPAQRGTVAGGYAAEDLQGPGSGQVYRVYEIQKGLKFVDADNDPIDMDSVNRAIKRMPKAWQRKAADHIENYRPYGEDGEAEDFTWSQLIEASHDFVRPDWMEKALIDQMKSEGYDGVMHEGGHIWGKGDRLHEVKIYWNPKRDIRLRAVEWRHPDLPVAPPTVGHEWGTEVGRRTVPSAVEHPPSKPISALERFQAAWGPGTAMAAESPSSVEDIERDKARRKASGAAPSKPASPADIEADKKRRKAVAAGPPDEANAPWLVKAGGYLPGTGQFVGELATGEAPLVRGAGGGIGYGGGELINRAIRSHYGYPNPTWGQEALSTGEAAAVSAVMPAILKKVPLPAALKAGIAGKVKASAAREALEETTEAVSKMTGVTREAAEKIAKVSNIIQKVPGEAEAMLQKVEQLPITRSAGVRKALADAIGAYVHEAVSAVERKGASGLEQLAAMRKAVQAIPERVWMSLYGYERTEVERLIEQTWRAQQKFLKYPALRDAVRAEIEKAPYKMRNWLLRHMAWLLGGAFAGFMRGMPERVEGGVVGGVLGTLSFSYLLNSPPMRRFYERVLSAETPAIARKAMSAFIHALTTHYGLKLQDYLMSEDETPAPVPEPSDGGSAAAPPVGPPTRRKLPPLPPSGNVAEIPSVGPPAGATGDFFGP